LAHGYEKLSANFTNHQKTVSAAFREVNTFIKRLRAEVQTSAAPPQTAPPLADDGRVGTLQKRIADIEDSIRQHSILISEVDKRNPPRSDSGLKTSEIASKLAASSNVKEQLKDMLEVIDLLKDEQDTRDAALRAKVEGMNQIFHQNIKKSQRETETVLEPLQNEVNKLKDRDFSAGKEFEYMIK